ncbi:IclR family transcriptional regulator [Rhodococcus globerulus]|uniref:IclR family transcriptional regulator n=1 Tax=Rhodococcus globerulus TaxID=33008 RepID=UPI003AFB6F8D
MTTCNFDLNSLRPEAEVDVPTSMIERMSLILDAFQGSASRLTLEEVTATTRLPRSTAHRILEQLVRLNWVSHGACRYRLGKRSLTLGSEDNAHGQIRAAASPMLHLLQLQTGMVVHLTVLQGGDIIYLDKIGGRFAAALPSRVGGRAPAYSTAGGKAMLAWHTPERVDSFYGTHREQVTERTITDPRILHMELNRIRQRRGLAFEQSEAMRGIACAGAAIRIADGPVAAISLCGTARDANLERFAPRVMEAAGKVSRVLISGTRSRSHIRQVTQTDDCSGQPQTLNQLLTKPARQWT